MQSLGSGRHMTHKAAISCLILAFGKADGLGPPHPDPLPKGEEEKAVLSRHVGRGRKGLFLSQGEKDKESFSGSSSFRVGNESV